MFASLSFVILHRCSTKTDFFPSHCLWLPCRLLLLLYSKDAFMDFCCLIIICECCPACCACILCQCSHGCHANKECRRTCCCSRQKITHEFHETCRSVTLFFLKKKTPNDAVTPQHQSQFTPKMKANAVPRLLSSLV